MKAIILLAILLTIAIPTTKIGLKHFANASAAQHSMLAQLK